VNLKWIGCANLDLVDIPEDELKEVKGVYQSRDCIPLFISKDLLGKFGFYLETIVYPLFHSFKGLNDSK
jgi:hypothetical protein